MVVICVQGFTANVNLYQHQGLYYIQLLGVIIACTSAMLAEQILFFSYVCPSVCVKNY